ncbi:MAG TPA: SIMPL domain-containing protein [Streptosporangiaceae bacterium]|nr:SIMPL domain-containing protein [Streptosporangiaceae bacterium]
MTAQPSISVRGEATLEVDPEIAVISVTVMARDADRHRVLDLFAKRNAQMMALVRAQGDAVEKIESTAVSVHPEFKADKGKERKAKERIVAYVARGSVNVTVGDFTVLGDLVAGLVSEEMIAVTGPWWSLRPGSPVHRQARQSAAREAVARAREYAEAFGGEVNGLTEVADAGLLTEGEQPVRMRPMAVSRAAAFQAETEDLEFEPAKQTVRVQVEARFTMTAPELGT